MHTATIHSLDLARKTTRLGRSGAAESPRRPATGHERRSSLPPLPAFDGDVEITAELLLAMENHPLAEVAIWVFRGSDDRRGRVAVRVGTGIASAALSPRDARFTADILFHEQAFPGCLGVADRLNEAADEAEALNGLPRRRSRRRFRSSHGTMIGLAALAVLLCAIALADALAARVGG